MQSSTANGQPSNGARRGKRSERQLIRGSRRRKHSSRDVEGARRLRTPLSGRCRRPPAPLWSAGSSPRTSQWLLAPLRVRCRRLCRLLLAALRRTCPHPPQSPPRAPVEESAAEEVSAPLRVWSAGSGGEPPPPSPPRAPLRCQRLCRRQERVPLEERRYPLRCWQHPLRCQLPAWESES